MADLMGSFDERMGILERQVGYGKVTGRVVVDQIYAQNQHESVWFKHPAGGKAKYLSDPLFEKSPVYMQRLADAALDGRLGEAMIVNMEDLSKEVFINAPWEFADLRASGNPIVHDGPDIIYDRPPLIHRLSHAELKAKDHLRALGFGHNP